MRILLTTSASYLPTRGGATRCNRIWLERLASHGHECLVITPSLNISSDFTLHQLKEEAEAEGFSHCAQSDSQDPVIDWHGVSVKRLRQVHGLENSIRDFAPDWILVSSEDFGQARLRTALRVSPEKVIYIAHTPQFLPFGLESLNPNLGGTRAVSQAAAVIVISKFVRDYFEMFLPRPVVLAHPPLYGQEPFANYGECNNPYIAMINPCAVKGLSIFLSVASRCTMLQFAALSGWGTTSRDIETMQRMGVRILSPCGNIDELFAKTRVLLVPSLWAEGFGLVVVEAMLRGIPVLTSNLGGLPEAKLGTNYVFPVSPISRYLPRHDEHLLPIPEIPPQNVEPWCDAIRQLTEDKELYISTSQTARSAAQKFVERINPDRLENLLTEMLLEREPSASV